MGCAKCEGVNDLKYMGDCRMRRWMKEHIVLVFVLLALLVVICTFFVNTGGAWFGGPASVAELMMTLFYIAFWLAVTILSTKYTQLTKLVFVFSLITFVSSIFALYFRIKGGFVLAVILSIFASVPFYGLRYFVNIDWTSTYGIVVAISTVWVGFTWWISKKVKRKCV